jgi:cytochrome c peroxidase
VPGRVIPSDSEIEKAVWNGERLFSSIGCASCHKPTLPLTSQGWIFTEPNPFNPPGNLQAGGVQTLSIDLTDNTLPGPRLQAVDGVVQVPAFTDLKLHDITSGPDDPNREPLDMQKPASDPAFFSGNAKFITRKLWGAANEPPFFHHGQYTTLREAVLAHAGEAAETNRRFQSLSADHQDAVIEFLKSLQVLPPGSTHLIVDEHGNPRPWPPRP